MNFNLFKLSTIALISLTFGGFANSETAENNNGNPAVANAQGQATLNLVANGEDFVRQGFVTKDGWTMSFDPKATRSVIAWM